MHVVFVEPSFPSYQLKFVRALKEVGARVSGVGETPRAGLPDPVQMLLDDYFAVSNVCDESELFKAVRLCQKKAWVDRLEATIEAHMLPTAKVREACSIPGTTSKTAFLCRDKPAMKIALREAGIPCAQSIRAHSLEDISKFIARVGFPVVIKPIDAAGAAGTYKVDQVDCLASAAAGAGLGQGKSVAIEEFVEGHEGFFDTITIQGKVHHEFVSHYYPNVLDGMRHRWISPQVVTTNRLLEPGYQEIREMANRVHQALGIGTSATHIEWFYGPKGLKISEIGCRPPGVGMWDVYCAANDMDLYREWAMAIVHNTSSQKPSRKYSAGMIALRPDRNGRVSHIEGLEEVQKHFGQHVIDAHFPAPGTPTQPIEGGFWANAWVRMRHPDYDQLRSILDHIGTHVKIRAT